MAQNSPVKKSPVNVKTHQEALGFLFGRNLSTFDHLLPVKLVMGRVDKSRVRVGFGF